MHTTGRRPFIFDDAMALLMEQTARYMQQTQAEHRLAVHFELTKEESGMHFRVQVFAVLQRPRHACAQLPVP